MLRKFYEKRNFNMNYYNKFVELPDKCKEMFFYQVSRFHGGFAPLFDFFQMESATKSPIEKIFLMAFLVVQYEYSDFILIIKPQRKIDVCGNTYYADFLIYNDVNPFADDKPFNLIVECDGHDFHKITKQQVKHDNERDMNLKKAGYDVLHFSGSQLYEKPWEIAYQVLEYLEDKIKISHNPFC